MRFSAFKTAPRNRGNEYCEIKDTHNQSLSLQDTNPMPCLNIPD